MTAKENKASIMSETGPAPEAYRKISAKPW